MNLSIRNYRKKKKINKDSYLDLNTLKKKDITKVKIDNITLFPFLKRFTLLCYHYLEI